MAIAIVENVLVDRTKFSGTSADWGANVLGTFDLGGPMISYQVSALNGFGYKADPIGGGANRSKGIDFEGRINLTWDGFVAAVGGYDGKLGKDVQNNQINCGTHFESATCLPPQSASTRWLATPTTCSVSARNTSRRRTSRT